jgi:NADH-quinone oxidoreductase subunit A
MENSNYGYILLFFAGAVAFGVVTLWMSRLLGPHRPSPEKNSTYECGEIPIGAAWVQFNIGYYIFALIFVIFDVETIFIYPWAVIFHELMKAGLGPFALFEMTVFVVILALGLIYAWRKGVLKWV